MSATPPPQPRSAGRLIAGILLVLIGVVFTLDTFGIWRAGDVFRYWPLILVGIGLTRIFSPTHGQLRSAGVVITVIGLIFLVRTLDLFWFRSRDLWPVFFLLAGGALIWQALAHRAIPLDSGPGNPGARAMDGMRAGLEASAPWRGEPSEAGALLSEFAFMGGGDRVVRSQEFRGGEVTAVLGGFKIDLRGASIAGDSATIEIFTFWGGVELLVPEDWAVAMHGTPILGMFTNSAHGPSGAPSGKTLIIRGAAIMGGVEVKN